jgi:hypothetical protein
MPAHEFHARDCCRHSLQGEEQSPHNNRWIVELHLVALAIHLEDCDGGMCGGAGGRLAALPSRRWRAVDFIARRVPKITLGSMPQQRFLLAKVLEAVLAEIQLL